MFNNCYNNGYSQDYIWIILILILFVFLIPGTGFNNGGCVTDPCC